MPNLAASDNNILGTSAEFTDLNPLPPTNNSSDELLLAKLGNNPNPVTLKITGELEGRGQSGKAVFAQFPNNENNNINAPPTPILIKQDLRAALPEALSRAGADALNLPSQLVSSVNFARLCTYNGFLSTMQLKVEQAEDMNLMFLGGRRPTKGIIDSGKHNQAILNKINQSLLPSASWFKASGLVYSYLAGDESVHNGQWMLKRTGSFQYDPVRVDFGAGGRFMGLTTEHHPFHASRFYNSYPEFCGKDYLAGQLSSPAVKRQYLLLMVQKYANNDGASNIKEAASTYILNELTKITNVSLKHLYIADYILHLYQGDTRPAVKHLKKLVEEKLKNFDPLTFTLLPAEQTNILALINKILPRQGENTILTLENITKNLINFLSDWKEEHMRSGRVIAQNELKKIILGAKLANEDPDNLFRFLTDLIGNPQERVWDVSYIQRIYVKIKAMPKANDATVRKNRKELSHILKDALVFIRMQQQPGQDINLLTNQVRFDLAKACSRNSDKYTEKNFIYEQNLKIQNKIYRVLLKIQPVTPRVRKLIKLFAGGIKNKTIVDISAAITREFIYSLYDKNIHVGNNKKIQFWQTARDGAPDALILENLRAQYILNSVSYDFEKAENRERALASEKLITIKDNAQKVQKYLATLIEELNSCASPDNILIQANKRLKKLGYPLFRLGNTNSKNIALEYLQNIEQVLTSLTNFEAGLVDNYPLSVVQLAEQILKEYQEATASKSSLLRYPALKFIGAHAGAIKVIELEKKRAGKVFEESKNTLKQTIKSLKDSPVVYEQHIYHSAQSLITDLQDEVKDNLNSASSAAKVLTAANEHINSGNAETRDVLIKSIKPFSESKHGTKIALTTVAIVLGVTLVAACLTNPVTAFVLFVATATVGVSANLIQLNRTDLKFTVGSISLYRKTKKLKTAQLQPPVLAASNQILSVHDSLEQRFLYSQPPSSPNSPIPARQPKQEPQTSVKTPTTSGSTVASGSSVPSLLK